LRSSLPWRRPSPHPFSRASATLHHLDWFEVTEIRGEIENGAVAHYQVTMKVGFKLDDPS